MAIPNLHTFVCPDCEGYGKKIDYFRLPEPAYLGSPRISWRMPKNEPTNSQGYYYTEFDCDRCLGRRTITEHLPDAIYKLMKEIGVRFLYEREEAWA